MFTHLKENLPLIGCAGLALLVELVSVAHKHNHKINFSGLPDTLLDLAEMSNVKHLLVN